MEVWRSHLFIKPSFKLFKNYNCRPQGKCVSSKWRNNVQCPSVADLREPLLARTPLQTKTFLNSMHIWQNRMLVPPLEVWHTILWGILDPPLHRVKVPRRKPTLYLYPNSINNPKQSTSGNKPHLHPTGRGTLIDWPSCLTFPIWLFLVRMSHSTLAWFPYWFPDSG